MVDWLILVSVFLMLLAAAGAVADHIQAKRDRRYYDERLLRQIKRRRY